MYRGLSSVDYELGSVGRGEAGGIPFLISAIWRAEQETINLISIIQSLNAGL
jgi:hypothetical protein